MKNYQELQAEIKEISEWEDEKGNKMWGLTQLQSYTLVEKMWPSWLENFKEIKKHSNQPWHSFVREIFVSDDELRFLKQNLCDLILQYRKTPKDYFDINKDEKSYTLPDRITDLSKLILLHSEFFKIYKKIVYNIHFENPVERYHTRNVTGRVNWSKTIQMSKTEFPTYFFTQSWAKKFQHPGNILLILCIKWQQKLANKILHIDFEDKLSKKELEILHKILDTTKNSLMSFPFSEIINEANKYENLEKDHYLIKDLQHKLHLELKQKKIRNPEYENLLKWIEDFDEIDFSGINKLTSNFILELSTDIDLAYEGWVFWKLISIFYERHFIKNLVIQGKEQYFEFIIDEKEIRIYHGKYIKGYAKDHDPDFTVFVKPYKKHNLLCIFDAKNTDKLNTEMRDKIGSYKDNLQCRFGGLIMNGRDEKDLVEKTTKKYWEGIDPEEISKKNVNLESKTWHFPLSARDGYNDHNNKILNKIYDEIIQEIKSLDEN